MKTIFESIEEEYLSWDGQRISREYGTTPNGNDLAGKWVLRDAQGTFVDFDKYVIDLAERNNISLCYFD